jgi:hypothetical protein
MDKKKFNTLLNNFKMYQNNDKIDEKLLNSIIDAFNNTMLKHYNNIGMEWINWFMFENDFGKKDWSELIRKATDDEPVKKDDGYGAHDENGKPICYDIKSLWEYIQQFKIKN